MGRFMSYFMPLLAVVVWAVIGFYAGKHIGVSEGKRIGAKQALSTNPVSEELDLVCAGLWVGEQNKKHWEKNK